MFFRSKAYNAQNDINIFNMNSIGLGSLENKDKSEGKPQIVKIQTPKENLKNPLFKNKATQKA